MRFDSAFSTRVEERRRESAATRPRTRWSISTQIVSELTIVEKAVESPALPALLGAVGAASVYWFAFARPEFGDLAARTESLKVLLSGDRLGSSFLIDLGLYAVFQSWLIPDDLKRRGVAPEDQGTLRAVGAVPFVGLVAYLVLRPGLREASE